MKNEDLFRAITDLPDRQIEEAEIHHCKKKAPLWRRYAAAAAALILVAGGVLGLWYREQHGSHSPGLIAAPSGHTAHPWSKTMSAADYFRDSRETGTGAASSSEKLSDSAVPWAETRSFSEKRAELETESVLPARPEPPLLDAQAYYNADGSVYKLTFRWYCYQPYSSLELTVAPEEIHEISDVVAVALDENGNVVDPTVTVTVRDGVCITGEIDPTGGKTLTWQTEHGWYELSGFHTDSEEDMAALLDWFWDHPIDFSRFPPEAGDEYAYVALDSYEGAEELLRHVPDFRSLGYFEEGEWQGVTLKNGAFSRLELHYLAGVTEEQARESLYAEGARSVSWSLSAEPDYYERQETLGELEALSFEQVAAARAESQHIRFTWDGYSVAVYMGSNVPAEELWRIVASVQSG